MITDKLLELSSEQAVTATAVSTNTIDKLQNRDVGEGNKLFAFINVIAAVTAVGAATVTIEVIESASADLSSPVVLAASAAIPKATLVSGYSIAIPIPPQLGGSLGLRYLGLRYTVATGPLTAGTFTASIVETVQNFKAYPSGFGPVFP